MLTNPRAERVASVRALARRSVRERSGRYLVEGPQAVREAVTHRPGELVELYLTSAAAQRHPGIAEAAQQAGVPVFEASDDVLAAMADSQTPQGVLAVCRIVPVPLVDVVAGRPRLVVVLAQIRDPGNAGTVIRAADAFGADAVVFTEGSVDPWSPKVVRSGVGSSFHLPIVTGVAAAPALAQLRAAGIRVFAADGAGGQLLPEIALDEPHAWVFGNEAWGLTPEVLQECDQVVRIPVAARLESLNLAMAATVCLWSSSQARGSGETVGTGRSV